MLNFFRKYQRFFFLIITIVIIVSFSFFGTYSALVTDPHQQKIAFTAIDGTEVTRAELDQMATFIGTDMEDKLLFGGAWGPNFLNDGVLKSDLFESGVALILANEYGDQLKPDLQAKLEKEKRYALYQHPQAKFINTEAAWGYFYPVLKSNYNALKKQEIATSPEGFAARVNLYLAEKKFPAPALKQVLIYQQRQQGWLGPDEALERGDLSLFGYHTAEDWFGPRFIRLASQFIINTAKIAQQKGYEVSKEETLVDLMRNAELSFQQNRSSPYVGVATSQEYFNEQLRRIGMDQTQAIKIWRQVLLARRLLNDVGNSVFVDSFEYQNFDQYAKETVEGELYQLPKSLRFATGKDLQKFEVYLQSIAKKSDTLALPAQLLTIQEIENQTPQLVQKKYVVEVAEFDKKNLQSKVGIKEMWNWEVDDKNWETLKKEFPELALQKATNREERFAALDSLNDVVRMKVDTFARNAIVNSHPEWLQEAISQLNPSKQVVGIRTKGGGSGLFATVENSEKLTQFLDNFPIGEKPQVFTADNNTYYLIQVLEKQKDKEVLTFAEASSTGVADKLLRKKLEAHYQSIREARAAEFQKADKSWKELSEVQDVVAESYFEPILKTIRTAYPQQKTYNWDFYATHRLLKPVEEIKDKIQKNPNEASQYIVKADETNNWKDQWKLEKSDYRVERSETGKKTDIVDSAEVFSLKNDDWSKVHTFPQGNITFFHLKSKKNSSTPVEVAFKMEKIQDLLGYEAQQNLVSQLLSEMRAKDALSLQYLNPDPEAN